MIDADQISKIKIAPDIAHMLGFEKDQFCYFDAKKGRVTLTSVHPVDMSCSLITFTVIF